MANQSSAAKSSTSRKVFTALLAAGWLLAAALVCQAGPKLSKDFKKTKSKVVAALTQVEDVR